MVHRWHMKCYRNHNFYFEKAVDARIEASLNEPQWGLDGIWDVAKTVVFTMKKMSGPVSRRASMSFDGASMAYEILQKLLFLQ